MDTTEAGLDAAQLRRLARKSTPRHVRKDHGTAAYATVRWLRKNPKVSDAALTARADHDIAVTAIMDACKTAGLPDPTSLNFEYTRFGRYWNRRRLAKVLNRCGITPDTVDRIAIIDVEARFDQYALVVAAATDLANAARAVIDAGHGGDTEAFAVIVDEHLAIEPAQRRTHYAWLRRLAKVDAAAWDILAPVAADVAHLSLAGRARLILSGLLDTVDAGHLAAAEAVLSSRRGTTDYVSDAAVVAVAADAAKAFDGDVARARLVTGNRTVDDVAAAAGTRDAIAKWGTPADAAYAHLASTPLARYAADIAYAFTVTGMNNADAKNEVRKLSPPALTALLEATPCPTRQDIVAAVRIVSTFRRRSADYTRAIAAAARRHDRRVPSLSKLGAWLPVGVDLTAFANWLLANQRAQAALTAKGRAELSVIASNFSEVRGDEAKLSVPDIAAVLRLRGYGPVGETAFGQVCAEANIPAELATATVERWTASLSTPQLYPTGIRFTDDKSGLTGRFLPRDDPRGLWLGQLTDCCQYPSSAGETCAWAGCEKPLHGFFVVETADRTVVAQSWVWSDGKGGVCFDSVERRNRRMTLNGNTSKREATRAKGVRRIYRSAAEALLGWFDVVNVGPAWGLGELTANRSDDPLSPHDYRGYRDSNTQSTLATRDDGKDKLHVRAVEGGYKVLSGRRVIATVTGDGITAGAKTETAELIETFEQFGHDTVKLGLSTPS